MDRLHRRAPAIAVALQVTFATASLAAPTRLEVHRTWAELGTSVAFAGDVNGDGYVDLIVGAPYFQPTPYGADRGRVYLFLGSASGLSPTPSWVAEGQVDYGRFGLVVAPAGDVNGDGFADVLVGAPFHTTASGQVGRAFLFLGSRNGLGATPAWTVDGDRAGALLGVVASAGDVDGDGFADVLVGAPNRGGGTVYLYLGSPSGLSRTPAAILEESSAAASFGFSVASAGDVNGDGFADVVVGAYGYGAVGADTGRAFLFLGSRAGLTSAPAWTFDGSGAGALFGESVASAGDVNGDGFADVIIGAPKQGVGGEALVFFGGPAGLASTPAWIARGATADGWFGSQVASAGDIDGDGFADVIIGAFQEPPGGAAYVFFGSAAGLGASADHHLAGEHAGDGFGLAVASAGRVGSAGSDAIAVGAPYFESEEMLDAEGAVYVYASADLPPGRAEVVDGGTLDAGLSLDGGPASDGGSFDAGLARDAGAALDGGSFDAGLARDAGAALDGGSFDAGLARDAGAALDGGHGDAGLALDAGHGDAGLAHDGGGSTDGGSRRDGGSRIDAGAAGASDGGQDGNLERPAGGCVLVDGPAPLPVLYVLLPAFGLSAGRRRRARPKPGDGR